MLMKNDFVESHFLCHQLTSAHSIYIKPNDHSSLDILDYSANETICLYTVHKLNLLGMDEWIWQYQELHPDQLRVVTRLNQTEEIYSPPVRVKD